MFSSEIVLRKIFDHLTVEKHLLPQSFKDTDSLDGDSVECGGEDPGDGEVVDSLLLIMSHRHLSLDLVVYRKIFKICTKIFNIFKKYLIVEQEYLSPGDEMLILNALSLL